METKEIAILGAGIFGLSAAWSLARRGHRVTILEPGPIPHPLASSTDISKVIRMEYGADELYMRLGDQARLGWLEWNQLWGQELYSETGLAVLSSIPMEEGSFEGDSFRLLQAHGFSPERLNTPGGQTKFGAWRQGKFIDGFFHAKAGYAESGRVLTAIVAQLQTLGVELLEGQEAAELRQAEAAIAIRTTAGDEFLARKVLVAAGVMTPYLVPSCAPFMRIVGQPVFHLQVEQPEAFTPPAFCTFTADISRTGWYGFPLHPSEQVLKVANHGIGREIDPRHDSREVDEAQHQMLREFLSDALPSLVEAPVVSTRLCLYTETFDGHFWIDGVPGFEGLYVATGGSGHGFKFGPVLGELTADLLEGAPHEDLKRFAWRQPSARSSYEEEARYTGPQTQ